MKSNENLDTQKDTPENQLKKESDFVVKPMEKRNVEKEKRLSDLELEKMELKESLSDFPEGEREIISKYANGEEMSTGEKRQIFMIKNDWWKKKRNCYDDADRQQYLKKKFSGKNPFEQDEKTANLQREIIEAFKTNDQAAIARLHQEYIARFPEQIEGVEALMGLNDYFENDKKIPASRIARKELREEMQATTRDIGIYPADSDEKFELALEYNRMFDQMKRRKKDYRDLIQDQAAFQTLIGDFVKNNLKNEEFLKSFWELNSEIGTAKGNYKNAERLRAGVLSQVAIIHTLKSLGWNPRIVHPEEDAFKKTDLKLEIEERGPINVQIKGTPKESQVIGGKAEVVNEMKIEKRTDEITIPGSKIEMPDGTTVYVTDYFADEFSDFKVGMNELKEELKKKNDNKDVGLEAYMFAIPHNNYNSATGWPSDSYVKFVEEKFGRNPKAKETTKTPV